MRYLRPLGPVVAGLLALIALTGFARAETTELCRRYRAELASLERAGGDPGRGELAQLRTYYAQVGCEGGRFLFFDTRPPQCEAVAQRIRYLSAQPAEDGYTQARRRQLLAAVSANCDAGTPAAGRAPQTARGGGQVICVRTCDGGYFPMNNLPEGRDGADTMCQALCPGTQAVAYSMPAGDEGLKQAASVNGRRAYSTLPNAFKFRAALVPDCSCKGNGQSWAQLLAKAESMLDRHKGDIVVTAAQAERLSRPKVRLILLGRADRAASTVAGVAASAAQREGRDAETAAETRAGASVPTAGRESAGIGPKVIAAAPVLAQDQGPVHTEAGADGEKQQVRVIAPNLIPVPRAGPL
jgi:hypothetical protein